MTHATQKPAPRRQGDTRSPDADKSAARRELRTLDADRIVVLRTMLERTPDELRVRGCDPETIDLVRQVQRIERKVREGHEQCHRFLRARQAAGATPPA